MPSPRPAPSSTVPPSRLESARERAAAARRGLTLAAFAAFGVGVVLVRASHPAAAHSPSPSSAGLTTPASLLDEIQGSSLGGGSISPQSGPPAASTATS